MTDVRPILDALAEATPAVRETLRAARGNAAAENPSGDAQSVADVRLDDLFRERLTPLDAVGAYASEERETVEDVGTGFGVAVDPLDGSSNLRSNNAVGTIVGVYDASLPAGGRELVAGAFLLYGPLTTMTAAVDGEATRYAIEDGEIVGSEPVVLPDDGKICGFAGATGEWSEPVRDVWRGLHHGFKLRYTGAMVGDVAHLLADGGLLGYPERSSSGDLGRPSSGDSERSSDRRGDLRLQFEANPIAYVVEAAGGRSSTGRRSILDVDPEHLHGRTPTYVGNADLIEELESTLS